jgi:ribosomal protein S18 acetylase RimI-like enzyme
MEVRVVREHEVDEAGQVVLAAYAGIEGAPPLGHGYDEELLAVGRRARQATVLVAVDGGRVVGCVTLVEDSTSAWAEDLRHDEAGIRMLAVAPDGQGEGVGRLLVEACIERALAAGKPAVFLHSTPWMRAAHRLYERLGFQRVPERDWLPLPEVPLLAFRLALDLDGAPTPASHPLETHGSDEAGR